MLIDTLRADMKTAMKEKDAVRLRTVRSVIAAVQEAEVAGAEAKKLDDEGVEQVIRREAKKRQEAAAAYDDAERNEQADAERAELAVLETYLPKGLDEAELVAIVDRILAENGFVEKSQMGAAMKAINTEVSGRADGRAVADLVKERLS